jgi:hypothetical protein
MEMAAGRLEILLSAKRAFRSRAPKDRFLLEIDIASGALR